MQTTQLFKKKSKKNLETKENCFVQIKTVCQASIGLLPKWATDKFNPEQEANAF